ncbi:MAG: hypothetical protein R3359_11750 [Marinirhabdus sp.]|nr:hypothetical protein [Marinirhabdus sp.]
MLLIYTQKITPRFTYAFKHILFRILGIQVQFTTVLEEFIAHNGPKLSYGKQPLGNELFVQEHGLLGQQGIEDIPILVKMWDAVPAFFATSDRSAIPYDIFASAFYLLSRYEEYLPHVKDHKGRFPASESMANAHEFLELPVVDLWTYKFKDVLKRSFPEMDFPNQTPIVHTVLHVQQPFKYRQKGMFRSLLGYIDDLAKLKFTALLNRTQVILRLRKDPYDTFNWVINVVKRSTTKMTAFFLLGENEYYKDSLNTHRNAFSQLVKFVGDYNEVGLLYSGSSLVKFEVLQSEIKRIEAITNRTLISGKQANFFLNLPENYRNLIELEIAKDFTMAYYDTPGFRAGTCTPFLFYDLDYEIKTPLLIQPIAVTSDALRAFSPEIIEKKVNDLLEVTETVNGTFSMVFTNEDFSIEAQDVWKKLFSETLQNYE